MVNPLNSWTARATKKGLVSEEGRGGKEEEENMEQGGEKTKRKIRKENLKYCSLFCGARSVKVLSRTFFLQHPGQ